MCTSSPENDDRKKSIKMKNFEEIQHIIVSFTFFERIMSFLFISGTFFGLAKCDSPVFILRWRLRVFVAPTYLPL